MFIRSGPLVIDLIRIFLRLGGVHAEMRFRPCIGHVMASSGLQELLELMYAPNALVNILNGKVIARTVRAHFIVDVVINAIMLTNVLDAPRPSQPDKSSSNNTAEVGTVPPDDLLVR